MRLRLRLRIWAARHILGCKGEQHVPNRRERFVSAVEQYHYPVIGHRLAPKYVRIRIRMFCGKDHS